jgi:hypothetical protein
VNRKPPSNPVTKLKEINHTSTVLTRIMVLVISNNTVEARAGVGRQITGAVLQLDQGGERGGQATLVGERSEQSTLPFPQVLLPR